MNVPAPPSTHTYAAGRPRGTSVALLAATALASALIASTLTQGHSAHAETTHAGGEHHQAAHAAADGDHARSNDTDMHKGAKTGALNSAAKVAFHDQMRKLWEDHVTWTRLAIVTFAAESDSFGATATRLLQNQTDIGDAIKPFYGAAAGDQLTDLLKDHITIAVELLQAAKAGDTAAFEDASRRWDENANAIADHLSSLNPRDWPQADMRAAMKAHLDQTLAEAAHELGGDYAASVADYEEIHEHILAMADVLSNGIIRDFPRRFR